MARASLRSPGFTLFLRTYQTWIRFAFARRIPKGEERLTNKGSSYVLNEYICVSGPGESLFLNQLKSKSDTIIVFTISDSRGTSTAEDHTHSRGWFIRPTGAWNRILSDIQPDRFGGAASGVLPEQRGAGLANYLFADGHVDVIPASQIREWAEAGFNFARPPGTPP